MPNIIAIGVANPPYRRAQHEVAELICEGFKLKATQKKALKAIYKSSGIEYRHSVIEDYTRSSGDFQFFPNHHKEKFPSTSERMKLYQTSALPLALMAINNCFNHVDSFDKKKLPI
ncbi:hypothetical protein Loa_02055 [Legionella oakridgensis ATCC 33761 = DSM 21215]|uniref:Uncharacterized protein n=1 Tax=Legionella oakridgensis ATCC 33761 = DSM 21215 TaxID=1268635 RepID=W0BGN8_9GAMM|nr:hypothetical protein [Legionella oakridgensis]AHE67599.1 hypothetical protein Loa_02055 [Legionella oakridgensis ATCC 33761 = DSM 21215]